MILLTDDICLLQCLSNQFTLSIITILFTGHLLLTEKTRGQNYILLNQFVTSLLSGLTKIDMIQCEEETEEEDQGDEKRQCE